MHIYIQTEIVEAKRMHLYIIYTLYITYAYIIYKIYKECIYTYAFFFLLLSQFGFFFSYREYFCLGSPGGLQQMKSRCFYSPLTASCHENSMPLG